MKCIKFTISEIQNEKLLNLKLQLQQESDMPNPPALSEDFHQSLIDGGVLTDISLL